MTVLELPIGPEILWQLIPVTPEIDQLPEPVGVSPLVGPDTVAVNVNVEPSAVVEVLVVTTTVGVNFAILKLNGLKLLKELAL